MRSLVTAIRTLTILPVPGKDTDRMESTLPWFPIVGLILGGILYGIACAWLKFVLGWAEAGAAIILIGGVVLTRGLHLDGFADFLDGFGGGYTKERVLEIMKDSAVGAFGAIGIVCLLLLKWVCLVRLFDTGGIKWIIAAYVISRTMQVSLAVENPYARSGPGTASSFVGAARPLHAYIATLGAVVFLLAVSTVDPLWLAVLVICRVVTVAFGRYCRKRIDGVTGDLLGACSEVTEALVLLLGCLLIGVL